MATNVRVRFAPSPTGPLHIGGVRTALYNYLFAKKHNGVFILRIEDTDKSRYVESAEQYIINALNWCGIPFDEGPNKNEKFGPYRQSERKTLYKQYAEKLIANGNAYYAFDTPSELNYSRKEYEKNGETFIYGWHNRKSFKNSISLSAKDVKARISRGDAFVIRFLNPENDTLTLNDIIRGSIEINTQVLDDKVLFKSDGMPTYHLANVVDDHLMKISHVIRGEEWLPSLALHQQLYNAFSWSAPKFAHLPLILKPTGKGKLSKRDGDKLGFPVFPIKWVDPESQQVARSYQEDGYFSDSVVNFLALIGWNPGSKQELFNLANLVDAFDLDRVQKSGARFDPEKIKWFNRHYMQQQENKSLVTLFKDLNPSISKIKDSHVERIIGLVKERATFVSDFWELSHFFFIAPFKYEQKSMSKTIKNNTAELMEELIEKIKPIDDTSKDAIEKKIKNWIAFKEIGVGRVIMPLRLALVGSLKGPDVFDIIHLIGKAETIKRIKHLIQTV